MSRSQAGSRAVDLLHELVAIPSVTGSETAVLEFLEERSRSRGWTSQAIAVAPGRWNLLIWRGHPRVVLTTHADTVPAYFEPRREGRFLFARGACDAKASLAAMLVAVEELSDDTDEAGLLVLVGEERGSDGAIAANRNPLPGVQFLVGGEPTGNRFAQGSKGCLRLTVEARGQAGHSSAPETGRSAVLPLLDFLEGLRQKTFPADRVFGETSMNIGILEAGSAPNVLAENARAEILFRTGLRIDDLLGRIEESPDGAVGFDVPYRSDPILFRIPRGGSGDIVSFACDLPLLTNWGEPLLLGPGSILDAHAAQEKVDLEEVEEAVAVYADLTASLLSQGEAFLAPKTLGESGSNESGSRPFTVRSHPRT